MVPQEFVSIRGEVRSVNERLAEHSGAPPVNSMPLCFFHLEGESEAKISLYKVVVWQIREVITNFAENPDMGSKAIFDSAPNVAEHLAATRKVLL
jgi:hypothetical protein